MEKLKNYKAKTMNGNQLKRKLPSWVFIVAMFICAAVIVLVTWQSTVILKEIRQISADIANLSKSKFADWKTYRNEEYGFELKYPMDATIGEMAYTSSKEELAQASDMIITTGNLDIMFFQIYTTVDDLEKHIQELTKNSTIISRGEEKIGDITAKTIVAKAIRSDFHSMLYPHNKMLIFKKDNLIFRFIFGGPSEDHPQISEEGMKTFNQILSTFKFSE